MRKYYWLDTQASNGSKWTLYVRENVKADGDEAVVSGEWPEDAISGDYSPSREQEIWDEVNTQILEELGFLPDYDVD